MQQLVYVILIYKYHINIYLIKFKNCICWVHKKCIMLVFIMHIFLIQQLIFFITKLFIFIFFGEVSHFGINALWIDVENEKLQTPGSFVKICQKQKLKVVAALINKQTNNMTVCDVVLKYGNLKLAWNFEMLFRRSLDIYLTKIYIFRTSF